MDRVENRHWLGLQVDSTELISGLSVLCGGSREDKVRAAFELYDGDGDGALSREELCSYLTSVFKVLYEGNRGAHAAIEVDARTLAEATTNAAFSEAERVREQTISLEEFTQWCAPAFSLSKGDKSLSTNERPFAHACMSYASGIRLLLLLKLLLPATVLQRCPGP